MKLFPYLILLSTLALSACDGNNADTTDSDTPDKLTGHLDDAHPLVGRCVVCHGKNGETSLDGAPFLAGQHEDYLVTAMTEYVTGVRKHAPMKNILVSFSEQDRRDIAAFYASKKLDWKASTIKRSNQVDPKKIIDDLGKRGKIVPCASCHGQDGNSSSPGVPSLSSLEPEYIEIALNGYLNGQRTDPFMTTFKLALSGVDIKSLAQYFSGHQARKSSLPAKGNATAGKKASEVCIGCHGINGNSLVPSIPSLAGQNADYLAGAMKTYKTGTRKNKMMRDVMHKINDKTMQDIAAYYARQTPTKRRAGTEIKTGFSPLSDGENIAMVCNGCHGKNGNSTQADIPSLTRLHPDYLKSAIKSYRDGSRQHEIMSTLVAYLSDVEIEKVGLYYATLTPEKTKHQGKGSDKEARKIVAQCNNCHGNNGSSDKAKIPTLAGQSAFYLTTSIDAYRSGARKHEDMQNAVKALSADDIRNISTYYAAQIPKPQEKRTLLSPQQLSKKCDHCHGENGHSTNPSVPRLAGQVPAYIEHALLDYQNGQRTHSTMNIMSEVLSLVEINAVAEYYFEQGKNRQSSKP